MPRLEFFYEFASTYSYLSALRIAELGRDQGVEIVWRPFLLGPIFASQGWTTSPFNVYPAKGRYMVRDIERIAKARGRKFVMPEVFPAHGLAAARVALCGEEPGWIADFTRRVYEAQFETRANIANLDVLTGILHAMNLDAPAILAQSRGSEIKDRLRAQSQRAVDLGLFGAPSFVTPDEEVFWGDDRLEQALAWTLAAK
jgi:2-hydroxychromene-2-carboxylate isomerase